MRWRLLRMRHACGLHGLHLRLHLCGLHGRVHVHRGQHLHALLHGRVAHGHGLAVVAGCPVLDLHAMRLHLALLHGRLHLHAMRLHLLVAHLALLPVVALPEADRQREHVRLLRVPAVLHAALLRHLRCAAGDHFLAGGARHLLHVPALRLAATPHAATGVGRGVVHPLLLVGLVIPRLAVAPSHLAAVTTVHGARPVGRERKTSANSAFGVRVRVKMA
mmetsp:Transcript_29441/g.85487  ORF Transcript_29441/g.85487 Transcript_29441/m.85487 type:complete len:219 (+) Transcript_29441:231-887(+)